MKKRMIGEYFPVLVEQHAHPRDKNIARNDDDHTYIGKGFPPGYFTSVTTWKESFFTKFDSNAMSKKVSAWAKPDSEYVDLTAAEIRSNWGEKRELGKDLHRDIEGFLNDITLPPNYTNADLYAVYLEHLATAGPTEIPADWQQFIHFIRDNPYLRPYRVEWIVYHEEYKLCGTIDAVFTLDRDKFDAWTKEGNIESDQQSPQNGDKKFIRSRNKDENGLSSRNGDQKLPQKETHNGDQKLPQKDPVFIIIDWKRCKRKISRTDRYNRKLQDPNLWFMQDNDYWKFAFQLNLYRIILEKYNIKCDHMYVVRFHPESTKYQVVRMPRLDWWLKPLLRASVK